MALQMSFSCPQRGSFFVLNVILWRDLRHDSERGAVIRICHNVIILCLHGHGDDGYNVEKDSPGAFGLIPNNKNGQWWAMCR